MPRLRDGWRPEPMAREHVLFDALWIGGRPVAYVEAFDDDGPWYAIAITPEGDEKRLGAGVSAASSAQWAEIVSGYRVAAPPKLKEERSHGQ